MSSLWSYFCLKAFNHPHLFFSDRWRPREYRIVQGGSFMKNRNIKVKPGKTQSMLGFVVGILFVILGITIVIPMFGLFGILWTVMAGFGVFFHYKNAFTEKGIATHEIVVEEDSETSAEPSQENIEDKLIKLESLYHQGLITQEEYDSKRKEILDRL